MTVFHETDAVRSWGRVLRGRHAVYAPSWRDEAASAVREGSAYRNGVLALGLGRSYGDSGLNPDGAAILTTGLDRIFAFDPATRLLRAEAGVSFASLLAFLIPKGFFLPVTPGTSNITLGGAVANDVHGKNHHGAGSFGCWVRALSLVSSDGSERVLRPEDTDGMFAATIGGLGLTGLIAWVEFEVIPIKSSLMDVETLAFGDLAGFFALAAESEPSWDYTVSWIDCFARGGRGLFFRGRHAETGPLQVGQAPKHFAVPMQAPGFLLGGTTMRAFNGLYYAQGRRGAATPGSKQRQSYLPYFYPLDAIQRWNLLYGKRGLFQYQSVVPPEVAAEATEEMLRQIAAAGEGSFLAVLKTFGNISSPGMLSFPRQGTTLALDFANRGASTLALLARLDAVVREAGGRLYPAKDGRIPPAMFRSGYPAWQRFAAHADPGFSSAFWRRMQTRT